MGFADDAVFELQVKERLKSEKSTVESPVHLAGTRMMDDDGIALLFIVYVFMYYSATSTQ